MHASRHAKAINVSGLHTCLEWHETTSLGLAGIGMGKVNASARHEFASPRTEWIRTTSAIRAREDIRLLAGWVIQNTPFNVRLAGLLFA